ncbi:MAG: AI-2E family transporter [Sandaracinaceae bacterium]|nr:AI-2E family transporter [Sandaracinaceae bacterium]
MRTARWLGLPRWVVVLLGVGLLGLALWGLRGALTPIFFAFLIAYLLDPVVDRLEARRIPRALGIVIVLFATLGALALFLVLVVPGVIREVVSFGWQLPHKLEGLRDRVEPWLVSHGVPVPHTFEELRALLAPAAGEQGGGAGEIAGQAGSVLSSVGEAILGGTTGALGVVSTLVVVPVFAFYFLYDFDRIVAGIRDLLPWRYRPLIVDVAREVDAVLSQFVRGQLLVMLILAALYAVGYSIAGVPLAIPIAIVAGALAFIPYVGGATALILALAMTLLNWQGWGPVIGVLVVYGVVQILEGFVITPRIVGDKVGLHAVWVLVALMVGGEIFGFLGVLLAVPAAAVCKIFVVRALAWYRETGLFREGGPQPSSAVGALAAVLAQEGLPDDAATLAAKLAAEEAATEAREPEPREPEPRGEDASEPEEPDEDGPDEDVPGEDVPGEDVPGEDVPDEDGPGEGERGLDGASAAEEETQ